MSEIWKDIDGTNSTYQVSSMGRIKSRVGNKGKMCDEWHLLKPYKHKSGYLYIKIRVNGKKSSLRVHRIVASAFLKNDDGKSQINHINGDKTDNSVNNLEWCDASHNIRHGLKTGLIGRFKGYKVAQYDLSGKLIKIWNNAQEIQDSLHIHKTHICMCAKGKVKTAHGYVWKYPEREVC